MKQSELKTYLSVLKSMRPKKSVLTVIQGVASKGDVLATTDLDHFAELSVGKEFGDGVYDDFAIDLLATQGIETDISKFKTADISDYPSVEVEWSGEKHDFCQLDLDHIFNAVECVSKDDTRPVLELVAITDGLITATDGYVAYATKCSPSLSFPDKTVYMDKATVSAIKKLRKFGVWSVELSKDELSARFTNGVITIMTKNTDLRFPDIRELLRRTDHFNTSIVLDFATLSALANKDRHIIDINPMTKTVLLEKQPTGVEARTYGGQSITRNVDTETRKVIMPIRGEDNHICLDLAFLKRINKNKSITLLTNDTSFGMIEVL